MLEEHGIKAVVVDARQACRMGGKKTDVSDCQWIQQLASAGLLAPCFVPEARISELRAYRRHRQNLVESSSQQILLMQKALTHMNVQLHHVLSDISGVSGMAILRAIVAGEREGDKLASLCKQGVKAKREDVVKALEGHWSESQLLALKHALQSYDAFYLQIQEVDEKIASCLAVLSQSGRPLTKAKGSRKNQLRFDVKDELTKMLGTDLTEVEGFEVLTVLGLLSECGTDLSAFPTSKHFCSWLGLAPNNRITGGKVRSRRTRHVSSRIALLFRLAAQSLSRSQSWLGGFLRSVAARKGMPKAIVATARKLAVIYYNLLTKGGEYTARSAAQYEDNHKERRLKNLRQRAKEFGYHLVAQEPEKGGVS
jgi:transposase